MSLELSIASLVQKVGWLVELNGAFNIIQVSAFKIELYYKV